MRRERVLLLGLILAVLLPAVGSNALAVQPVVKTVPWVATNSLVPHDTVSGTAHTLKGTANVQGANFSYSWDFGDGSAPANGTVGNQYVIQATHTYTGVAGTIFAARLTVQDTGTGETDSEVYYVSIRPDSLEVRVNMAIDQGLWYLHQSMARYSSGGLDYGYWGGYYGIVPANVNAFEVNGHLENGNSANPYVETVQRGMRYLFTLLQTEAISSQTYPDSTGTVNPDSNGNGYGVRVAQSYYPYQGGMFMDAIIASGAPTATTATGQAPSGTNPGILGRTYFDIIQDMVDSYAYGQYNAGSNRGGWRYDWNQGPDNSACQWAAIGLIAAERQWGATVPDWVKTENEIWLNYSHFADGRFGYTGLDTAWGYYATTPSGLVQLAMDGIGRGDGRWETTENYLRTWFCNTGGASNAIRDYYYGMFSFTKAMLLHDPDGNGVDDPVQFLENWPGPTNPIDWYAAEASQGDACDGVARTLVNDQSAPGYWSGHNYSSAQYPFETAWAIIMLNRTVFASGVPVAVAEAIPNPGVVGQTIVLDGSGSFHQDPSKSIVSWEWDLDNDGSYGDATGPLTSRTFPAIDNYSVGLRVTDGDGTTDTTTVVVQITQPPVAPTADADGPYSFCPQTQPWFLDGSGSVNPDDGAHLPGAPGDMIQAYEWDLDGDGQFDDASGAFPDVTAYATAAGPGSYLIQLKVTDTTGTSFPGFADLSDTDSAQVIVRSADDPACSCVDDLAARAKRDKIQLTWTYTGAASYNVYRSTTSGGPYSLIANTTSTYSTYLDQGLTIGTTYYYVVREVALNTNELCQSNEASATTSLRR